MITLKRDYHKELTVGQLILPDGFRVATIELPWLNNRVGESCIPEGIYKFKRDHYGKHQWWSILDVEGRTAIEIHEGYSPEHSEGCVLMSESSLNKMLEFFDDENTYVLEIIS